MFILSGNKVNESLYPLDNAILLLQFLQFSRDLFFTLKVINGCVKVGFKEGFTDIFGMNK